MHLTAFLIVCQVRCRNQKTPVVECPLCMSRLIVCLNSVGDASEAVPYFTLDPGPSNPCNRSPFRGCQQLPGEENVLLGSDLCLEDALTHSSGRIRGSVWKFYTIVAL